MLTGLYQHVETFASEACNASLACALFWMPLVMTNALSIYPSAHASHYFQGLMEILRLGVGMGRLSRHESALLRPSPPGIFSEPHAPGGLSRAWQMCIRNTDSPDSTPHHVAYHKWVINTSMQTQEHFGWMTELLRCGAGTCCSIVGGWQLGVHAQLGSAANAAAGWAAAFPAAAAAIGRGATRALRSSMAQQGGSPQQLVHPCTAPRSFHAPTNAAHGLIRPLLLAAWSSLAVNG